MAEKGAQAVFTRVAVASPAAVKPVAFQSFTRVASYKGGFKASKETTLAAMGGQRETPKRRATPFLGGQSITTTRGTTPFVRAPSTTEKDTATKTPLEGETRVVEVTTPSLESRGKPGERTTAEGPVESQVQAAKAKAKSKEKPVEIRRTASRRKEWVWNGFEQSGYPFHVIKHVDISPSPIEVTSSAGFQVLCSYSWQRGKPATIRVPGGPRFWVERELPLKLPPNKGRFFIDQNRVRMGDRPMEPLLRAADFMDAAVEEATRPKLKMDDVDVISLGNSLRRLLVFVSGARKYMPFRLDLSLVQDTLIIERCDMKYTEFPNGQEWCGWGRSFERAFTANYRGRSHDTGHFRALQYPLGDLNCIVLSEIDAFVKDVEPVEQASSQDQDQDQEQDQDQDPGQDLPPPPPPPPPPRLRPVPDVITKDLIVKFSNDKSGMTSQSALAEVKSLVYRSTTRPSGYMPQLWFARIPWLIVGKHREGNFDRVNKANVEDKFAEWEELKQTNLRKLVALLRELRDVMRKNQSHSCRALFARGTGGVFVDTDRKRFAIPEDLIERLWTRQP
ncbi:hypothetical protein CMUS01_07596 [Colletotrichum musicola]|uniref:Geranylgeranyl pyrophosphate synthetase n=1 Tax=Colletotrichum musicola TaxID=2175873 RepID=A0A8H6KGI1_9PEZI|nr:hypothetical protein CMUS01_07596 [Colletotrichum musicola]